MAEANDSNALQVENSNQQIRKHATSNAWLKSCQHIQQQKMTPEMKKRLKKQANRQRKIGKKCKRAKVYQKANEISRKAWAQGNMRLMSAPAPAVSSVDRSNYYSKAANQMHSIQRVYADVDAWNNDDDAAEEAMENQLALLENEQLNDAFENDALNIDASNDNSIQGVLQQLVREPKESEEVEAKFKLYTDLSETVEASRKATNDFWADCKPDFPGNVVKQVENDIRNIDSEDNLGCAFGGHRWFVYDMTVKADQNNTMIKGILKMIETKLGLLNNNDDNCPFCLDPLAEIGDPVVLGCCHKACKECWEHWQEIKGRNAFCPLCRQEEFLSDIVNM